MSRSLTATLGLMAVALAFGAPASRIAAADAQALTGTVSSAKDGPMEGVIVTVKRAGSTIATSVVSDRQGHYRFPRARLAPGDYALRINAVGYDLDQPAPVSIAAGKAATADLRLVPAKDMAAQLSNTEWFMSWPGSDAEKAPARGCTHCHTLERIARSHYTADQFMQVIQRMSGYPALSFPLKPQKAPAARTAEAAPDMAARRRLAEYLASVNQSQGPWKYPLKALPRPTGRATQVIYTEYDLPSKTRQPHDVIVDAKGMAWFADFGDAILGKLDPTTGKVTEYPVPVTKPGAPSGTLALRFDHDGALWLANQFQASVAKFDPKTEKWAVFKVQPEIDRPDVQLNLLAADHAYVDGKVWLDDAGSYQVLRLDLKTGRFEVFSPYPTPPRLSIYDVMSDAQNNAYFTVFGGEEIGRIDAKTGKIQLWKTPTRNSAPRRGMIDHQGRLWFGENRGDKLGMFDPRTQTFKEWATPTPMAWPYDVTADTKGEVWTGGEWDDRILRLNPSTGEFVQYLLPRATNLRRVWVQNSTTPTTFWVGNNHEASIVKLEPLN